MGGQGRKADSLSVGKGGAGQDQGKQVRKGRAQTGRCSESDDQMCSRNWLHKVPFAVKCPSANWLRHIWVSVLLELAAPHVCWDFVAFRGIVAHAALGTAGAQ